VTARSEKVRTLAELLAEPFALRAPVEGSAARELQALLPPVIPADYFEMFRLGNGGAGDVGGGDYAELWSIDELESYNEEYEVLQQAPGLILFGSNGGGEAFAFNLTQKVTTIGIVPFIGMSVELYCPIADTFLAFLNEVASGLNYDQILSGSSRH
jgi:hypothetical protein